MAKMGKSMSVGSRLAAATALTGTLAACDGRLGTATDALFQPISTETPVQLAERSPAPAAPGNPVYIGGSEAANNAQYRSAYGAPVQGSGQAIAAQPTFAGSVYQDSTISATPITNIPGGPVIDAGVSTPTPVYTTESLGYSAPGGYTDTTTLQPQYSAPVLPYSPPISAPTTTTFPSIGSNPVYLPQSSLPQHILPTEIFADASASDGSRDIEPLLDAVPQQSTPYGSTASHRYSVAEEPLPVTAALLDNPVPQYSTAYSTYENDPFVPEYVSVDPVETVEVAALGASFVPMPRARPAKIGPVFETKTVAQSAPAPKARPSALRTSPLPLRRPLRVAALSGQAITDAPPLTEAPQMIEVEAVFLDEPMIEATVDATDVKETETASLEPMDLPKEPVSEKPELSVTKPDDIEQEMAAMDTSKVDVSDSASVEIAALAPPKAPRVEIDDDIGDLKELSGTSWRLSQLDGEDVAASAELHFDGGSGFAGGQGICNNYGGEFSETLKGDFKMANIFSTETECEHFALEKKYIVALETAKSYRMAPGLNELSLLGPDGKAIARFAAF